MAGDTVITVIGNLTGDPELRYKYVESSTAQPPDIFRGSADRKETTTCWRSSDPPGG